MDNHTQTSSGIPLEPVCGPGPADVENETFTVHNPLDLGPVAPLPVLERAVAEHVVPRITRAAKRRTREVIAALGAEVR